MFFRLNTEPESVLHHAFKKFDRLAVFGVKVAKVNTVSMRGKFRRQGRNNGGYSKSWKKAIVKLTEDSKPIEFFEGMM